VHLYLINKDTYIKLKKSKKDLNLNASLGVAIREYQTNVGPADYVLFVNQKPVGIIEAKRKEEAIHFSEHEDQSEGYASAKLKYLNSINVPVIVADGCIDLSNSEIIINKRPCVFFPVLRLINAFHL